MELVRATSEGLYCPPGDFYIDPWRPVQKALITHGHSDHARWGSTEYHANDKCVPILHLRLGQDISLQAHKAGEKFKIGNTWVSFLGSCQVRIEHKDQVWVASGDYKRTPDPSCDPFEVVPCDTFISEATFALPVYKWDPGEVTAAKVYDWWQSDQDRPSLIFCYALGKAQRLLAELSRLTDRKVYIHGAMESITQIYRDAGIQMLPR